MKQILEIDELRELIAGNLTKREFLEAFKKMVEQMKEMKAKLEEKIDEKTHSAKEKMEEMEEMHRQVIEKIENENEFTLSNVKRWALEEIGKLFVKSKIKEKLGQVDEKLNELNAIDIPDTSTIVLEASKMAQEGLLPLIPIVDKLEEKLPELGAPIRDALTRLEDEERLKIPAIHRLREELDELRRLIAAKTLVVGSGGSGGGHIVKSYDLSDSLNGATKVFTMPAFWRIIAVNLSSFPNALRATTDYTSDAGAHTLTFTDAIDVGTSLATGQTCIVIYSE